MGAVARSLSCHEVAFKEGASVRHSLPLYLRLQQQQQGLVLGQLVVRESVIHFFELRESTKQLLGFSSGANGTSFTENAGHESSLRPQNERKVTS